MLKVRSLVVSYKEDMEMWIKFSNLCRKSGRVGLSFKTLSALLDTGPRDFNRLVRRVTILICRSYLMITLLPPL
jgi:FKBP12-rapamycin complex-associated protein